MEKDLIFVLADARLEDMEKNGVTHSNIDVKVSIAAFYVLIKKTHGMEELRKQHKLLKTFTEKMMQVHENG